MNTKTGHTGQRKMNTTSPKKAPSSRNRYTRKRRGPGVGLWIALIVGAAVLALGVIFYLNNAASGNNSAAGSNQAGKYAFQVGSPGPGQQAPSLQLPSTAGGTFDLSAQHGKTVLLYFQEGLTCQPCWDQLKDIQTNISQFKALGIDQIVSITTDPLNSLQQKVSDEGITIPVLSDTQLVASNAYTANGYGMMGNSRDGHTFIVVGSDGTIKWRADYGGAPNYTMYVPVSNLIAHIRAGLKGTSS